MKLTSVFLTLCIALLLQDTGRAGTFTVTSASDSGPGTLRQAILDANAQAGPDTIAFDLPDNGYDDFTIFVTTQLPDITDPVLIDGYTQPGSSPNTMTVGNNAVLIIELTNGSEVTVQKGLVVTGGGSTIRGLVVHGFGEAGIVLFSGNNRIEGNFVGTDVTGTLDFGNGVDGVFIANGTLAGDNNTIGGSTPAARNVISGNNRNGVTLDQIAGTVIAGNYIGTNAAGTTPLGNTGAGIGIFIGSTHTIGGPSSASGNLISGNGGNGVEVNLASSVTLQNNYIGTTAEGTAAIGNGNNGVYGTNASDLGVGTSSAGNVISGNSANGVYMNNTFNSTVVANRIGTNSAGTSPIANETGVVLTASAGAAVAGEFSNLISGNLISGNLYNGIYLTGDYTIIQGNSIGTNAPGTGAIPNGSATDGGFVAGIYVDESSSNTLIGGSSSAARNIISGNRGDGIGIWNSNATNIQIKGNYIGVQADGTSPLGNTALPSGSPFGAGVSVRNYSSNIDIGGTGVDDGNIIANNTYAGVVAFSGSNISIQSNAIFSNGTHGIELNNLTGTVIKGNSVTGNSLNGILIQWGSGAQVGGTTAAERNVVSGNGFAGVNIIYSSGNIVQGNYIGVNAAGTGAQGNQVVGVTLQGAYNNNILNNIISANGNGFEGGLTLIYGSSNTTVRGNIIGLNTAGTAALGNNGPGIAVFYGYSHTIGGTSPGDANTISANLGSGIEFISDGYLFTANTTIEGNRIGTDPTGNLPFGNSGDGIRFGQVPDLREYFLQRYGPKPELESMMMSGNTIGGLTAGSGNIIAHNGGAGVKMYAGVDNAIVRNSIFSNGQLGIDLGGDGVTPNHTGFADGPNYLQNYPILSFAAFDLQGVAGFMPGEPGQTYRVELFRNAQADPSGYGEGRTFVGSTDVVTDTAGNASFYVDLPGQLVFGEYITATATDLSGNTSEFSTAIPVTAKVKVFGDHYVVNTTLSGIPLHWPDGDGVFNVSANVPAQFHAPIVQGYQAWNNLSQLNYSYAGITPSTTWGGEPDGINNNVWVESGWEELTGIDGSAIAVTRVRYNSLTGMITDADIAYDAQHFTWAANGTDTTAMDVQNAAAHEAGHYSGLADIYNPGNPGYVPAMGGGNQDVTMFGMIRRGETLKRTLEPPDSAAIAYVYNTVPASRIDLMLVFDGSPSYTTTARAFTPSKESAAELVQKLRIGDRIGVVKMPNTIVHPLTTIQDSASRAQAIAAINGMTEGGPSAIGSGLQTAQNALDLSALPNRTKAMILFSAGEENTSPSAMSVLPALIASRTHVHTLGFPGTTGQGLTSAIADSTGGGYYLAADTTINQVVSEIWNRLIGQQYVFFTVVPSDTFRNVLPPGLQWQGPVDKGTISILPGLQWQGGPRGITRPAEGVLDQSSFVLSLLPPGGAELIDSAYVAQHPESGIQFFSGPNYQYFKINNPAEGIWQLYVFARQLLDRSEPVVLSITAFTDITMAVGFDKLIYSPNQAVGMSVSLSEGGQTTPDPHVTGGGPITDATVVATVTPPAPGSSQNVPLLHSGGGIYTGTFGNTATPGTYGVKFTATRDTVTRVVTQAVYVIDTTAPPPPVLPVNVVLNPGFEEGTAPWGFFTNGTGNFALSSPGASGSGRAARLTVTTIGNNMQFFQGGITVQPRKLYRLKFKAYSSNGRDLSVFLHRHDSPFTVYGLSGVVFDLTTSWRDFSVEFTTTNFPPPTPSNARLRFWLSGYATSGTVYYIDDVVLEEVNTTPAVATKIRVETATGGSGVIVPAQNVEIGNAITVYAITRDASDGFVANVAATWSLENIAGGVVAGDLVPAPDGKSATFTAHAAGSANIRAVSGALTPTTSGKITVPSAPPPSTNLVANGGFEAGTTSWNFYTDGAGTFSSVSPGNVGARAGRIAITNQGNNVQLFQSGISLTSGMQYRLRFKAFSNTGHDVSAWMNKHVAPNTAYGLSNAVFNLTNSWQDFSVVFTASGFAGTVNDARLRFWLAPYDAFGDLYFFDEVVLEQLLPPFGQPEVRELPTEYALEQNYPNPFNPATVIRFALPVDAHVTLAVYNVLGQQVAELVNGTMTAGYHELPFEASFLASGLYMYRITAAAGQETPFTALRKMLLVK